MSEYTPTTSAVRSAYTRPWEPLQENVAMRNAEFDRWLAQHEADLRAEGAADDREQWARKVAQALATTSVQSAQYIGQMVTGALDALLAMTRASVLAEAKAGALREAADALGAYDATNPPPTDDRWTCDLGYYGEAAWLRNRADALEAGQS